MQGLLYGDRRDRVKWGALVHLANTKGIRCIVQVAYFRHVTDLNLQTDESEVPLPIQVWDHFSNLRHIESLGKATGLKIIVLDQYFEPTKRRYYINMIVSHIEEINKEIKGRKIIFLDPDTGIEPAKSSDPEHVTKQDMENIWKKALSQGDILVVYQHADHTKKWLPERKEKMSHYCGGAYIGTITGTGIASDVAMLWGCKDRTTEPYPKAPISHGVATESTKGKKEPRLCACPCGQKTAGGIFCPGHDEKLRSIFRKVKKGDMALKDQNKNVQRMYEIWEKDNDRALIDIAREVLGENEHGQNPDR